MLVDGDLGVWEDQVRDVAVPIVGDARLLDCPHLAAEHADEADHVLGCLLERVEDLPDTMLVKVLLLGVP
jgi:hypothetical protein